MSRSPVFASSETLPAGASITAPLSLSEPPTKLIAPPTGLRASGVPADGFRINAPVVVIVGFDSVAFEPVSARKIGAFSVTGSAPKSNVPVPCPTIPPDALATTEPKPDTVLLPAPKSISPALTVSDPAPATDVGTVAPRSLVKAICGALRTTVPPSLVKPPALRSTELAKLTVTLPAKPMLL